MDIIPFLLEVLKITIPSLIVFLTAYYILSTQLKNDYQRRTLEMRRKERENLMPVRLQAYERLTLFIERSQPQNLLLRTHATGMTARELQTALLAEIRSEFDHNVSQQIFISPQTWMVIKKLKEDSMNLINSAASALPPQATGLDLSKMILNHINTVEQNPYTICLSMIRTEVQQFF